MPKDWMADEELKGRLLEAESTEEAARMLKEGSHEVPPQTVRKLDSRR